MRLHDIFALTAAAPLVDIHHAREAVAFLAAGDEINPEIRDHILDHLDVLESTIRTRNATI